MSGRVGRELAQAAHVAYKPATKSAHFAIGGVHRAIVELGYVVDLAFHVGERDRVIGGIALLN